MAVLRRFAHRHETMTERTGRPFVQPPSARFWPQRREFLPARARSHTRHHVDARDLIGADRPGHCAEKHDCLSVLGFAPAIEIVGRTSGKILNRRYAVLTKCD